MASNEDEYKDDNDLDKRLKQIEGVKVHKSTTLYDLDEKPVEELSPLERRALFLWKNGGLD